MTDTDLLSFLPSVFLCFNTLYLLQLSSEQSLYLKSHLKREITVLRHSNNRDKKGSVCFERVISIKAFVCD